MLCGRGRGALDAGSGDADVDAHIARLTASDAALKADLLTLVTSLKTAGVWATLDQLCVAHKNAADSLLNIRGIAVAPDAIVNGTPTFTTDRGYNISTGSYIKSNNNEDSYTYYALSDGTHMGYGSGDAGMGLYGVVESNASRDILVTTEMHITIQTTTAAVYTYGTGGCALGTTNGASDHETRYNVTATLDTFTPLRLPLAAANVLYGSGTDVGRISAWGIGGGLTPTQLSDYRDAIEAYAVERGFNV